MTRCAIYTRVSTEEQADTGHSLEAQMAACEALATAREWEVSGRYVDAGLSGGRADRPEWQRMQADARAGVFSVLIVHKLDRFSRDVLAGLRVIAELRDLGVAFVSVSEQFDFTTPMGGVMLTMLLAFAQLYRENLRAEVHKGRLQRARKGLSNANRPPFGYRRVDGVDTVVEAEAALWREAMERAAGGATDLQVAEFLNAQGATMPSGRAFTRVAVREMLRNPFYIGRVYWRGLSDARNGQGDRKRRSRDAAEAIPGRHEAIITPELWQRVRQSRASHKNIGGGVPRYAYLLRGIAHCAECGERLIACRPGANGTPRYVCRAYERNIRCSCNRISVREDRLADQLDEMIGRLAIDPVVLEEAAGMIGEPQADVAAKRAVEIRAEEKRLDAMFQRGRIDEARWDAEIVRLEAELAALQSRPEPAGAGEIASFLDAWKVSEDAPDDRRAVLTALLERVDVDVRAGRIVGWHARPQYATVIAQAEQGR